MTTGCLRVVTNRSLFLHFAPTLPLMVAAGQLIRADRWTLKLEMKLFRQHPALLQLRLSMLDTKTALLVTEGIDPDYGGVLVRHSYVARHIGKYNKWQIEDDQEILYMNRSSDVRLFLTRVQTATLYTFASARTTTSTKVKGRHPAEHELAKWTGEETALLYNRQLLMLWYSLPKPNIKKD